MGLKHPCVVFHKIIQGESMIYDNNRHEHKSDYNDEYDMNSSDLSHRKEVRRRLEERMERRRLKDDLEDYEGELNDDFDWDGFDK